MKPKVHNQWLRLQGKQGGAVLRKVGGATATIFATSSGDYTFPLGSCDLARARKKLDEGFVFLHPDDLVDQAIEEQLLMNRGGK